MAVVFTRIRHLSMIHEERKRLEEFASAFVGQKCWNISAGVVGSIFYADFGDVMQPLSSAGDAKSVRRRGEYVLEVSSNAWRIGHLLKKEVLASSDDDNSPAGPILTALGLLVGKRITSIDFPSTALDCAIRFDDELKLEVFSIGSEASQGDYALWRGCEAIVIGPRGRIAHERV